MIVADTNLIASLWVPNDMDKLAYACLRKDQDWVAPMLWISEFRNVLSLYYRQGILDLATVFQVMEEAGLFMKANEYSVNSSQVLSLIAESKCSAYDCEFVALASEMNTKLVTFDKKIITEFPSIAVHPKNFVSEN